MLLLRAGGLSNTQKVPLSSLTYTTKEGSSMIQQDEDQQQQQHQRSSRSSRKSKNGQKKIPQRGLGVAQLEKLRMEEQQRQEAACLASLQRAHALPPLTGALHSQGTSLVFSHNYASQIKGRTLQQHPTFMPPRNTCKMPDSIISMANLHSINLKQQIPMVGLSSSSSSPQHQSPREENRALSRNSSLGRSSEHVESCIIDAGVANPGIMAPGLWPVHNGNREDLNHSLNQELEMRKMDLFGIRSQNTSSPLSDLRFFDPLLRYPAPARKLPVVSISSSGATMQLEPPSNQSYSNTPPWTEEDRIAGVKRPWPFSEENPCSPIQSKVACLNVGTGIHTKTEDIADPSPNRLEIAIQEPAGVLRNSLGVSLEPIKKKTWQANSELASPSSRHPSELSFSYDSGSTKVCCGAGQAALKDSSSSSTSLQPGFALNWKGSFGNDISTQEIETPGVTFLTLGLSCSPNEASHGNGRCSKPEQYSATPESSDECQLPNKSSTHAQQEITGGLSTKSNFLFKGLLQHSSINSTETAKQDEGSQPFYKFLYESNNKGTADAICQDNQIATRVPSEYVDLDLRLSL